MRISWKRLNKLNLLNNRLQALLRLTFKNENLEDEAKLCIDSESIAQVLYRPGLPFLNRSHWFLLAGVKIVLIFTAIELTAVTAGFLIYCRHALDYEEIEISGTRLLVRKFIAYKESVTEFNTRWVRLSHPEGHQKVFWIEQTGQKVEIGQFLRREQFKNLIAELKPYLG